MRRFAVYRDISPTDVLFDNFTEAVASLFLNQRDAERRAAMHLNKRVVTAPPRSCAPSSPPSSAGGGVRP